jgi:hypothetical protein
MPRDLVFCGRSLGIFAVALALFLVTGSVALSAPITYTFSGTISGSVAGSPLVNQQVTVLAVGDAANATTGTSGISCNNLTGVTFVGGTPVPVTDTLSIFDNNGAGNLGLLKGTCEAPGQDWFRIGHAQFHNYNLVTSIAPLAVTPTFTNTTLAVNTASGIVVLSSQALNTFQATVTAGALENPQPSSHQSGIGLISGWICPPVVQVQVAFDGGAKIGVPYGGARADTGSICGGNINTGFGLLFNFNTLGAGSHSAVIYADGAALGTARFTVTTLGSEFLTGVSKEVAVPDFPSAGRITTLIWQQSQQNFAVKSVTP